MRIFLAPRSNETSYKNFLSTIENGVDYTVIAPHITEEGKRLLNAREKIFAWGNKETLFSFIKGERKRREKANLCMQGDCSISSTVENLAYLYGHQSPGVSHGCASSSSKT